MDLHIYMDDIVSISRHPNQNRFIIRNKGGYAWEISFTDDQFKMLKKAVNQKNPSQKKFTEG